MNINDVNRILSDTAYTRYGGSDEEKRCALYIKEECQKLGLSAAIESFDIETFRSEEADNELSHNVILDIKGESYVHRHTARGTRNKDLCKARYKD